LCDVAKTSKDKASDKPEKKTRKKKDADAPKKPMSAFFWYQQDRRNALKQEKPNLVHKEVIVVSSLLIKLLNRKSADCLCSGCQRMASFATAPKHAPSCLPLTPGPKLVRLSQVGQRDNGCLI